MASTKNKNKDDSLTVHIQYNKTVVGFSTIKISLHFRGYACHIYLKHQDMA